MTNLSNILKEAHKIARTLEGHYAARLSEGMKQAWANSRNNEAKILASFRLENVLESNGSYEMHIWVKKGIYTITTKNDNPDFDLFNKGCEDKEELLRLAKRSLKALKEEGVNQVINYINNL